MVTATDIRAALRQRYQPPEWALFMEVGNGTGSNNRGWADAVAMNLWPSRGLAVHGFEVKVSRSDWLRELRAPAKAEPVARYCDRWWLVAPDGVLKDGELPDGWGFLLYSLKRDGKGQLKVMHDAGTRESVPVTRDFLAALLRRASESSVDEAERQRIEGDAYTRGYRDGKRTAEQESMRDRREHERLQRVVEQFEEAAGVRLSGWTADAGETGALVRALRHQAVRRERVEDARDRLGAAVRQLEEALAVWPDGRA